MHAQPLFQKIFERAFAFMHKTRLGAFTCVCESLTVGADLTLTSMGRHLAGRTHIKHKIKKVDRLLGNPHLHAERWQLYRALAAMSIRRPRVELLVDWSPIRPSHDYYSLKVSQAYQGRSLPLYEAVYPERALNSASAMQSFLTTLKRIVPTGVQVVVITDAGFLSNWFGFIRAQGWHFIGGIREDLCWRKAGESWQQYKTVDEGLRRGYYDYGMIELTRKQPMECRMVVYKKSKQQGTGIYAKSLVTRQHQKQQRKALVLVTSLSAEDQTCQAVVAGYRKRMQIEQNFRDTKNARFGFGMEYFRGDSSVRMEMMLTLASVVQFMLMWVGQLAEAQGWQRRYQANTVRSSRVLSLVFLARQMVRHERERVWKYLQKEAEWFTYSAFS